MDPEVVALMRASILAELTKAQSSGSGSVTEIDTSAETEDDKPGKKRKRASPSQSNDKKRKTAQQIVVNESADPPITMMMKRKVMPYCSYRLNRNHDLRHHRVKVPAGPKVAKSYEYDALTINRLDNDNPSQVLWYSNYSSEELAEPLRDALNDLLSKARVVEN